MTNIKICLTNIRKTSDKHRQKVLAITFGAPSGQKEIFTQIIYFDFKDYLNLSKYDFNSNYDGFKSKFRSTYGFLLSRNLYYWCSFDFQYYWIGNNNFIQSQIIIPVKKASFTFIDFHIFIFFSTDIKYQTFLFRNCLKWYSNRHEGFRKSAGLILTTYNHLKKILSVWIDCKLLDCNDLIFTFSLTWAVS